MGKTGALFFVFAGLIVALALFQVNAQAACGECADGSSDSGDSSSYCECDEQEKCKDPFTKSTAWEYSTGFGCGDVTSGTDYCQDSETLKEAYLDCFSCDEVKWVTIDCNDYNSAWSYYESGSCVKRKRQDYYCTSGHCAYSWAYETVSCNGDASYCYDKKNYLGTGCSHGQYDCDWDSECSSGLVCKGPILGSLDGCCYSYEYWNGNTHQCAECIYDAHCPSDYCTSWTTTCTSTQVKRSRTCYDYYCTSSGACSYTPSIETEIWNNGHADFCKKKKEYCGAGCTRNQYDCDGDPECSGGLLCKGIVGGPADGCCYSYEYWAWAENSCCDVSVGSPYCSSLTNDVLEQFGIVSNEGYCQRGARVKDNCAADEVCSNGQCHDAIYYTTHFEIHYSVEGGDAPSLTDNNGFEDASGYPNPTVQQRAPDYIEKLAQYLEYGWDKYTGPHFNFVINRPTTKVYVEDCFFGILCDYYGWTNIVTKNIHLDNHLSDDELKTTAVHEFFHVIQMIYADPLEAMWTAVTSNWLIEGTAVWAEDALFDTANDYLYFTSSILHNTDQTLTSGGAYKGYSAVLYWKYFEKYGTQFDANPSDDYDPDGADIMGELWKNIKMNSSFINGIDEVDEVLRAHGSSWRRSFKDWLISNYAKDLDNDGAGWYDYEEGENMTLLSVEDGLFVWIDTHKEWTNQHVNEWASDYFMVFCNKSYATHLTVTFDGENNKDMAFILLYIKDKNGGDGSGNLITEEASLGSTNYFSTTKNIEDYERVVAIIGGMSDDGDYNLNFSVWCGDTDGDGYNDGVCGGSDCNDGNASIHPGAAELCDYTIDNDCDGVIDEGCVIECSSNPECGTDGWVGSTFCSIDDVYQDYRTYTCHYPGKYNSYCSYSDPPQMKQDCGSDSCGSWGSNYCTSDDLWHSRTCHDRGCSSGACFDSTYTDTQKVQECGSDSCNAWGPSYCKDGHVYHSRTCYDRGCSASSCYENQSTEEQKLYDCGTTGCDTGKCISVPGDVNKDCTVNIFDLAAVGLCYGKSATGSCQSADVTGDGIINIFDLAAVGLNYGRAC